ncbi:hypothetical protein [Pseudotabrizicola algicola]|uniref:Lipoprotein n=1 Tax=Pseudotabrizicola algicola TaxID=2709381 RepID=A0A6B3RM22_9RHOB|nr:hypothetical protein [Pseudotabrizicola algicola]NEX45315.1 hypothetical protein [Pseudotabrizicola algicola]
MNDRLPLSVASLVCALALGACVAQSAPPPAAPASEANLHRFIIDRAYTLTDSRELAFRDQIAAEAQQRCGFGGFSLYSSRPIGNEVVGEDFLYRQHDVQITCDDGT